MGFEETEEIGPDGKPHIISERSFGGPGKKLTKAEMKKQKQLTREMQVGPGECGGGGGGGGRRRGGGRGGRGRGEEGERCFSCGR
eukprot:766782-Hanusia_phi.AAC.2